MLSGIKAWLRHPKLMFARLRYAQISTKITCVYAAVLLLVLILTSTLTGLGVFFSFYHQAEVELEISMNHVLDVMEQGRSLDMDFGRDDLVLPGVVLRITDSRGKIVYENAEQRKHNRYTRELRELCDKLKDGIPIEQLVDFSK